MNLKQRIRKILKEELEESSRLPDYFYEDNYDLDENDIEQIFYESDQGDRVRYFVYVYYDVMIPSTGDSEKDRILAEKVAKSDLRNLKNPEYILGDVELRGYYR